MERSNHYGKIAVTILASGTAFLVNYFISFFLAPFITERVGTEAYGFVTLAKNLAVYATYITVALNAFSARFISMEYYRPDIKRANIFFSSTFWGDLILGGVIFAAALAGIRFLEHIFKIPAEIVTDVKLLFLFVFVKFMVVTVFSVFGTGAYVSNHLNITGVFKGLSYCVEAAVLVILFALFPPKVFYVGVGILAAALVIAFSDVWICRRYTGELRVSRADFRLSAVKTLVGNGVWSTVGRLGYMLSSGLDLTVCNLMISPLVMGQLALTESVGVIFSSIYTLVAEAFKPMILKTYAQNDKPRLVEEFKTASKLTGFVANLFFAGFLALGAVYYRLWVPAEDTRLLHELTMFVLGGNLLIGIEWPLFEIYTLTLKKKVSVYFTIAIGVLNVLSMYVLIKFFHMGVFAVVGTTLVLETLVHLGPHPLYMARALNVPWHTFFPVILRSLVSCAAMCAAFLGLRALYLPHSWPTLILCALGYAAVGAAIHAAIILGRGDWRRIAKRVLALIDKRHAGRKEK